jgi:pimeloyl-ACP methyl ester carboxylesterase
MTSRPIERALVQTSAGYLHCRIAGNGPPIVLLSAGGQSSAILIELMDRLSSRLRVIAVDHPSHGMSDHVAQPQMTDYARWLIEAMDALAVDRATVVAEATANGIALSLADIRPDRVDRIVMANCPFHADGASSARAQSPIRARLRPTDPSGFPLPRTLDFLLENDPGHAPLHPTQSWMDRINVAQAEAGRDWTQVLTAFNSFDLPAALTRLARPALLLMGEHFQYAKDIPEFTRHIADLRARIVPGGRFNILWEHATLIGNWIFDFCLEGTS